MPRIEIDLPLSLQSALEAEAARAGRDVNELVRSILAEHLDTKLHTVFQISTSGALVAGVSDREVSVGTLLEHGDFGLGTFAGLDGEMIVLDGAAYQAREGGAVTQAPPEAGSPFAVVTKFAPDTTGETDAISGFAGLGAACDCFRSSDNIFHAVRLSGRFRKVAARAVCPQKPGTPLVDAARTQSEFTFEDVEGTLVGIWSPAFSAEFSVEGYHFHFLSDDRTKGGHVLEVEAGPLQIAVETLNDFHLILPETESFLKANLDQDVAGALNTVERSH
ncbi:acetolactate decarboxylase [Xanthobacter sp. KR7-65]|uniref:acetolactate decarboxylase n=1 Tax=Xanthobacter sp. KR7-65 TaxID=3156612 RepID=UPI0032B51C5E